MKNGIVSYYIRTMHEEEVLFDGEYEDADFDLIIQLLKGGQDG